jgi:DNA repair protein RadC
VSPRQAGGGQITIRPLRRALLDAAAYLPLCGRARRPLGSTAAVSQATGTEQARAHNFHNHPSGLPEPSQADELITRRLLDALKLIHVRVLDHLIIGDGAVFSFVEHGLL